MQLARFRGDLTQEAFAEKLGIPFSSYQKLENGQLPRPENLAKIASALGIGETELFLDPDLVGEPTPEQALKVFTKLVYKNETGQK